MDRGENRINEIKEKQKMCKQNHTEVKEYTPTHAYTIKHNHNQM